VIVKEMYSSSHRIASRSRKQGSGHGVQTDDWGPASVPKIDGKVWEPSAAVCESEIGE
jgi:hypothetical protein